VQNSGSLHEEHPFHAYEIRLWTTIGRLWLTHTDVDEGSAPTEDTRPPLNGELGSLPSRSISTLSTGRFLPKALQCLFDGFPV